jgi:hypothetical protein
MSCAYDADGGGYAAGMRSVAEAVGAGGGARVLWAALGVARGRAW